MSARTATKKINKPCKSSLASGFIYEESAKPWLQAAETARLKIEAHRKKIRLLEEAARTFEEYAKEGQPWPKHAPDS